MQCQYDILNNTIELLRRNVLKGIFMSFSAYAPHSNSVIHGKKTFSVWSLCSFYRFHSLPCLLYWLSGLVYPFHLSFLDSSLAIESTLMTTQWEPIKFLVRCRSSRGICHQYQRKWLLFCLLAYYVGYRFMSIVYRCAEFKYFIILLFDVYVFKVVLLF